ACFAASKASIIYLSSSVIQLSLFYVYIPMQMHIITIAFFSLKEEVSLQIHVVQQGETLFSIERLYSTSIISITEANELDTPNLAIGQALVIPIIGQYYFIQEHDTLFTITRP